MYVIKIFDGNTWNEASRHTQEEDANRQLQIFKSNGLEDGNMKIEEEE